MGQLSPEVREEIIRKAISSLLEPSTNSWEKDTSIIQRAFNAAVEHSARELAREHVKNSPGIQNKLLSLVKEAMDKLISMDRDKLAEKVADAFIEGVQKAAKDRY